MARSARTGIRATPSGWQVFVRVQGRYASRRFPRDTSPRELVAARDRLKAELRYSVAPVAAARTLAQDAEAYLALVTAMPTYTDRAYRIGCWVAAMGTRPRASLTARDIRAQLEQWRRTGRHDGGPLTPASLNQRRTALMHLYTVLDGRSAANIVRDVPAYDERYSEAIRAESMTTCVRLIRHLRVGGKMRAVLYVLLWTGWPAKLLTSVTAADIDWARSRVRLARRRKGTGMGPAWVPVVPRALRGLRRLADRGWLGQPFSNSSLHSALARAVVTENRRRAPAPPLAPISPYGFRHSFATWAAARLKDDRALRELLRSNSLHRYTEGAAADRLASAVAHLAARPGNSGNFSGGSGGV